MNIFLILNISIIIDFLAVTVQWYYKEERLETS